MVRRQLSWRLAALILALLAVSACTSVFAVGPAGASATAAAAPATAAAAPGRAAPAGLAQEGAESLVRNALEAYNSGDYRDWIRNWAADGAVVIKEREFLALRERTMERYGRCYAVSASTSSANVASGQVEWSFTVECQSGRLRFIFAVPEGKSQVAAVTVEPLH